MTCSRIAVGLVKRRTSQPATTTPATTDKTRPRTSHFRQDTAHLRFKVPRLPFCPNFGYSESIHAQSGRDSREKQAFGQHQCPMRGKVIWPKWLLLDERMARQPIPGMRKR